MRARACVRAWVCVCVRALAYVCVDLPRGKTAPSSFAFSSSSPAIHCSPHLCVGFLFLILYPAPPGPAASSRIFVTHTIVFHTQLCRTLSFTDHLSHTTLSHTIFHTPPLSRNFVVAWHLATSTFVSRGRRGTWRHPPSFGVAGVALVALGWLWWRAWSPLVARDAAALCVAGVALMALGWLWWRAWSPLVARGAAALCVACVALGDIYRRFAWQAWCLATSTFVLRGRRGTRRRQPWFCVAGVALGDIDAKTQTSTQTSFIHTSRTHNLEHTSLLNIPLSHTNLNTHTHFHTQRFHTQHTHTTLSHKLEHTVLYTQLCHSHLFHELEHTNFHTHTQRFHTQTHKLPHTTLPRTTFHTQFFHTQIVTHNSFTHSLSHKTLLHTTLSHTAFHTRLFHIQHCHTQPFLVTHSTFTHNSFTHSSITHSSFTQSVFPIPFSHLF